MSARSSSISSHLLRRMPEDDSTANKATSGRSVRPRIVFPGGGIFFWWQVLACNLVTVYVYSKLVPVPVYVYMRLRVGT